jgi:hypothetical protein
VILAIDPGPTRSGWVLWNADLRSVDSSGTDLNVDMMVRLQNVCMWPGTRMAIEKIEAMGMAVGAEIFETVHWSGRFLQAWREPDAVLRITRRQVKLHLCGTMKAKDANVRQALLDLLGPQGTKRCPGPTYGVSGHEWSALAVAVTAAGVLPIELQATRPAPSIPTTDTEDPFA